MESEGWERGIEMEVWVGLDERDVHAKIETMMKHPYGICMRVVTSVEKPKPGERSVSSSC